MVKGPHLNLAQFDLDWGHQIPWQKVVEEWKQEQLEQVSWRTKEKRWRQLKQWREHIQVTRDQQQRTKTWTSLTPNPQHPFITYSSFHTPDKSTPYACNTDSTPMY